MKLAHFRIYWMEFAASITVAHACTWKSWNLILGPAPQHFHMSSPLPVMATISLAAWLAIITTAAYNLAINANNSNTKNKLWNILTIIVILSIARSLSIIIPTGRSLNITTKWAIVSALAAVVVLCIRWIGTTRFNEYSKRIFSIFWPLVIILWTQRIFLTKPWIPKTQPIKQQIKPVGNPIWIIVFDELDYKIGFGELSNRSEIPSLKKFSQESFSLTQATPPSMKTEVAIPSILLGKNFKTASTKSHNTIELNTANGNNPIPWMGQESLFHELKNQGRSIGILGWFLPYDRLFSDISDNIFVERFAINQSRSMIYNNFFSGLIAHAIDSLPIAGTSLKDNLIWEHESILHLNSINSFSTKLEKLITNHRCDVNWVHAPLPHAPAIRENGSYLENIKAADKLFYKFREIMTTAGQWDKSTIVIMADHWLRSNHEISPKAPASWHRGIHDRWDRADYRVPFMIKLPHQSERREYRTPINTALLRNLILAMDAGQCLDQAGLEKWLNQHRADIPLVTHYQ